ncbi:MAG: coproporphyrinogen III oxidase, partial [Rhodospirillales bacterium]|nr:coproporphyrinogen III oxidase [Rhodospirillales bacterium]
QEITEAAGLPAYEVSNHACPGGACRHNLLYWQGGDYLGIGPGAHGRLGDGATRALRQFRIPERWLRMVEAQGHGTEEITPLTPAERVEELLLMGLRLTEGVGRERFRAQTGLALEQAVAQENAKQLIQDGLIEWTPTHLRATGRGRPVLNALIALLTPEV